MVRWDQRLRAPMPMTYTEPHEVLGLQGFPLTKAGQWNPRIAAGLCQIWEDWRYPPGMAGSSLWWFMMGSEGEWRVKSSMRYAKQNWSACASFLLRIFPRTAVVELFVSATVMTTNYTDIVEMPSTNIRGVDTCMQKIQLDKHSPSTVSFSLINTNKYQRSIRNGTTSTPSVLISTFRHATPPDHPQALPLNTNHYTNP